MSRMIRLLLVLFALGALLLPLAATAAPKQPVPLERAAGFAPGGLGPIPLAPMRAEGPAASAAAVAPTAANPVDAWSRVAFQSYRTGAWDIFSMRPDGSDLRQLTSGAGSNGRPRQSRADGRIVFVSNRTGNYEIFTMDSDGSNVRQLTFDPAADNYPTWSPDGQRIAWAVQDGDDWNLHVMNADGTNAYSLAATAEIEFGPAWSPDGQWIAWVRIESNGFRLWIAHPDGSEAHPTASPIRYLDNLAWSPDSKFIGFEYVLPRSSFTSVGYVEANIHEHLAQNLVFTPQTPMTDAQLGSWSPDGKELLLTLVKYVLYEDEYLVQSTELVRKLPNWRWDGPVAPLPGTGMEMSGDWQRTDFTAPVTRVAPVPAWGGPDGAWVNWTGADTGGSGLVGYDPEIRINGGDWFPWHYVNEPTREIVYGQPGDRVDVRVRGTDAAGNVEAWPDAPPWDGSILFYADRCTGSVFDARGRPVIGARILGPVKPDALYLSGPAGQYEVFSVEAIPQLGAAAQGYAASPWSYLECKFVAQNDFRLTSGTEAVQNGGFEAGLQGWQVVGGQSAIVAHDDPWIAHSGQRSLLLGTNSAPVTHAVAQPITVPAADEKPTLSFLLRSFFLEAQLDHVYASVTEGSSAPERLDLRRTQKGRWIHAWADLTPWAAKQVTLTLELRMAPTGGSDPVVLDEVSVAGWHTPYITSAAVPGLTIGALTINGENFEPGATVLLDERKLTSTFVNANTLTAILPDGVEMGPHALQVQNPGGQKALTLLRVGLPAYVPWLEMDQ